MPFWLCMKGSPPFELVPGKDVTIGRGRHCDLPLYSSLLSREHARIRWERDLPVLFDLESLNGIFIGVDRLHRRELRSGDVIRMGDITLEVRESEHPPASQPEEGEAAGQPPWDQEQTPVEVEPGSETRFFSRTAALHQKLFEYDELTWLLGRVEEMGLVAVLRGAELAPGADFAAWVQGLEQEDTFWRLMELGLLAPVNPRDELTGLSSVQLAARCELTKRAERLQTTLQGGKAHWNEMAALRYKVRQGRIFQPLRAAARAYRPGGGLRELDAARLAYELENIYAADLGPERVLMELRRLLCLGFFCPSSGARGAAWYPERWDTSALVEVSGRGLAMLEGFRLEE